MARRVEVQGLSEHTVTRARGKEAAGRLLELVAQQEIDLYLDEAEVLSTSFLDEIVVELAAEAALPRVTFVMSDPATVAKLERIAAIREVALFQRRPSSDQRSAVRPSRRATPAIFSSEKVPAPHH